MKRRQVMLKILKINTLLIFCFFSLVVSAQNSEKEKDTTKKTSNTINFGWSARKGSDTLKPFFDKLKTAEYGVQRFSIFDQLIEHHTQKSNIDSVVNYANIYVKEIRGWDQTEHIKNRYLAKAHYYLGNGNLLNGLFENAIKWHIKGLQDAEKTNYTEYQYKNKLGLAKCYIQQSNYAKAITILQKSLTEFAPEYPSLKIETNLLLGKTYRFKEDFEKAESYYNDAITISKSLDDLEMKLTIQLELAKLAEAKGELGEAFQSFEDTRNEAKTNGLDAIYYEGSLLIARYYYNQGFYDAATIGLSMAYINAIDSENLTFQKEMLILQSKSFAKQDDFKNAYATMTHLFNVQHKIKTKQQQAIVKELEVQYETLEKEKSITSLKEDKLIKEVELDKQRTYKNAFLIGFLIILIPIIALLFVYYQKIQTQSELSKKQDEINTQKVKSLVQEQELNLIKAAIEGQDEERKRIAQELHDSIGGNLAGIKLQLSSFAKNSEALKTINGQIDETYQLVRDISHTLIPKKFKQNAFTDLIKEYANSISKTNMLAVSFHPHPIEEINVIEEKVQMELFKILQELMTNTLKHAEATKVDIHLNLIANELSLLFEDNGKGFDIATTTDGIGLGNIKSRIEVINGILRVDSNINRGTIIAIEIPNIKNV
ncbi:sensor histidine kinase [Cellulophaga sp. HaHaR_3_176]|nr:sensor histidine kinase [Cellulophaga sp. HaHaR_3_176]